MSLREGSPTLSSLAPTVTTKSGKKRKRTAQACDQCRARKHRCDGQQPICRPCVALDQECTYGMVMRKRGLPTGYVRSIEGLLGLLFITVPNGERTITELLARARFTEVDGKLALSTNIVPNDAILRSAWEQSEVQRELIRRLKVLEDEGEERLDISYDMDMRPPFPPLESIQEVAGVDPERSGLQSALHIENDERYRHLPTGMEVAQTEREQGPFPADSEELVQLYFSRTHPWLPILEKHAIFRVLYSDPSDMPDTSGSHAVLWALLATSSLQVSRGRDSVHPATAISHAMYCNACKLLPREDERLQLAHIQALLLLGLWQLQLGDLETSWRLLGRATRGSIIECSSADDSTESRLCKLKPGSSMSHRALLACFVLDTYLSSTLKYPPHLRAYDIDPTNLLVEEGPDEWDPMASDWTGPSRIISTFNCWVRVAHRMNQSFWCFSEQKPLIEHYEDCAAALVQCYHELPLHCIKTPRSAVQGHREQHRLPTQLLNLRLAFAFFASMLNTQTSAWPDLGSTQRDFPFRSLDVQLSALGELSEAVSYLPMIKCYRRARDLRPEQLRPQQAQTTQHRQYQHHLDDIVHQRLAREIATRGTLTEDQPLAMELEPEARAYSQQGHFGQGNGASAEVALPLPPTAEVNSTLDLLPSFEPSPMDQSLYGVSESYSWDEAGPFDPDPIDWSVESAQFMQNLGFASWETPRSP